MPAGKPESARGVGSLGSGRPSTGGRGSSTPSSFGKAKTSAMKPSSSATGKVDRKALKSVYSKPYVTPPRTLKVTKSKTESPKRSVWAGGAGRSARIVKPSAAGKKYGNKQKNLPKG